MIRVQTVLSWLAIECLKVYAEWRSWVQCKRITRHSTNTFIGALVTMQRRRFHSTFISFIQRRYDSGVEDWILRYPNFDIKNRNIFLRCNFKQISSNPDTELRNARTLPEVISKTLALWRHDVYENDSNDTSLRFCFAFYALLAMLL